MNRYLSSERWRKVASGWYASPDGRFTALRVTKHRTEGNVIKVSGFQWQLWRSENGGPTERVSTFVTLADCQEHAERLERRDASV